MDDQDWSDTFYSPGIRFLDAVLPSEGQWETGCARIKEVGYDEDELERDAAGGVVEETNKVALILFAYRGFSFTALSPCQCQRFLWQHSFGGMPESQSESGNQNRRRTERTSIRVQIEHVLKTSELHLSTTLWNMSSYQERQGQQAYRRYSDL